MESKVMYRLMAESISERNVTKETDKTVKFINDYGSERMEHKRSDWATWHNTLKDAEEKRINNLEEKAKKYLNDIEILKNKVESIQNKINSYKSVL